MNISTHPTNSLPKYCQLLGYIANPKCDFLSRVSTVDQYRQLNLDVITKGDVPTKLAFGMIKKHFSTMYSTHPTHLTHHQVPEAEHGLQGQGDRSEEGRVGES